jgi:uncharacterized protein (TIGR02284 family)
MGTAIILQELSELLTDSQRACAEAADRIKDPHIREILMKCGNSRAPLIEEVANELVKLQEEVPMDGTAKADLLRTWHSIKENFTAIDAHDLITELERSEEQLITRYEKAIAENGLPQHVREMLRQHRTLLKNDLVRTMILVKTLSQ